MTQTSLRAIMGQAPSRLLRRPSASAFAAVCGMLVAAAAGCTFYTECPTAQPNAAGGTGGTASGGTSGSGSDPIVGMPVEGEWSDAVGDLAGVPAGFANVCYVGWYPGRAVLIAGVSEQGLWQSEDSGAHWERIGTKKGSATIQNRTSALLFDPDDSDVFWEVGPYGAAVFRTDDGGNSFVGLGDGVLEQIDGLGIDFTDPDRKTMYAAQHERGHAVYRSRDGGTSWDKLVGPNNANPGGFVLVVDANTVELSGGSFGDGQGGIFRSEDAGELWDSVGSVPGWNFPLFASDGSIYWPVFGNGGVLRSTDAGGTWARLNEVLRTVHPVELPDGRVASVAGRTVVVSGDQGQTWKRVAPELPFDPDGIAYAPDAKLFFAWHNTSDDSVPSGVIQSFAFDYEAP